MQVDPSIDEIILSFLKLSIENNKRLSAIEKQLDITPEGYFTASNIIDGILTQLQKRLGMNNG